MNKDRPLASGNTSYYVLPLLLDATLDDLRTVLDSGLFTSVHLVRTYLARIEEVNSKLNVVTEINPDALSIASELDNERQQVKSSSGVSKLDPLHGIPILVKNNMATDDQMNTTAGSYALVGARVSEDSTIVSKLRNSGAIILGKANMSQWASCRGHDSPEGWSAQGGQTFGAYFPNQSPKASSSGSAVGASIGLAWASLGTDTGGSITMPATQNNVVGFRPTVGLTSRHLVIPYSLRLDTVGTLTRTVKDAAYLMKAIAGRDSKDPYTAQIPFDIVPDYVAACRRIGLKGKRIGITRNVMCMSRAFTYDMPRAAFNAAVQLMKRAGAEIFDDIYLPGPLEGLKMEESETCYPLAAVDFSMDLPKYLLNLRTNPNNIHSLDDLREFTRKTPEEQYPKWSTELWDTVLDLKTDNKSPHYAYRAANDTKYFGELGIMTAFEELKLDALVTWGPIAAMFCSRLGLPVVTVPLGKLVMNSSVHTTADGLADSAGNKPFGISFIGPAFTEETLFEIAYAFEQLTQSRKCVHPYVVPKTELINVMKQR
ncbi:amidase signature enzyme [Trichoderma ceciliae]